MATRRDGEYALFNVPSGPQEVGLDPEAVPVDFDPPANSAIKIEVGRGATRRVSFGLMPLGSMPGRVIQDVNGNGQMDPGEDPSPAPFSSSTGQPVRDSAPGGLSIRRRSRGDPRDRAAPGVAARRRGHHQHHRSARGLETESADRRHRLPGHHREASGNAQGLPVEVRGLAAAGGCQGHGRASASAAAHANGSVLGLTRPGSRRETGPALGQPVGARSGSSIGRVEIRGANRGTERSPAGASNGGGPGSGGLPGVCGSARGIGSRWSVSCPGRHYRTRQAASGAAATLQKLRGEKFWVINEPPTQ